MRSCSLDLDLDFCRIVFQWTVITHGWNRKGLSLVRTCGRWVRKTGQRPMWTLSLFGPVRWSQIKEVLGRGQKKPQDNKEVRSSCDQQETTTLTIEVVSWECNSGLESRAQGHHTHSYHPGYKQEMVFILTNKQSITSGIFLTFPKFSSTLIGFALVGSAFSHQILEMQRSVSSSSGLRCLHQVATL